MWGRAWLLDISDLRCYWTTTEIDTGECPCASVIINNVVQVCSYSQ